MKKCPNCNHVYEDETLNFCLDDGEWLIAPDEPATAILHETAPASEAATHPQVHTTDQTAIFPSQPKSGSRTVVFVAIGVAAVLVLAGFVGYRYIGTREKQIESIAVLPFENASGNADSEYLSDGLAESLIYRLSQLPNLKVSPRSLVFQYKGKAVNPANLASELGVDAVMTGRMVQRGENLSISVDLVDARSNKTLWGEQYERKMSDLLSMQREIATAIAEKLKLKLAGADSNRVTKQDTTNNEAYQLYLQGRYFWNKRTSENLRKATDLLQTATEKDPTFALAYAGLADCYAVSYYYVGERPRELMPLAKTYAAKAIELDPTLAEPHTTLGFLAWLLDWDKTSAENEFLRAIELNPNYATAHHWYSRYLRGVGRNEEAFKEITKAAELEPLSLIFLNNIAEMEVDRGDLDAAERTCLRITNLDPNFWAARQTLGIIRVKQGRNEEALAEAQKSVELSNRSNATLALLGHVYGRLGRRSDAEGIIKELEIRQAGRTADGRDIAIAYAGSDDREKAFEWLERAFQEHSVFMAFLNLEPLFEPLHNDPRWNEMKLRVGLPE